MFNKQFRLFETTFQNKDTLKEKQTKKTEFCIIESAETPKDNSDFFGPNLLTKGIFV